MGNIEELIRKASAEQSPAMRMAYIAAFGVSQYAATEGRLNKPFNPILGETFDLEVPGKYRYHAEQVSHHPPISAYYLVGRGYKKYGTIEPQISFGINKASGFSSNPHYIEYEDGMKI